MSKKQVETPPIKVVDPALWKTNPKYSHTNQIQYCKKCRDTSYELKENGVDTGKCCRCGELY